METTPVPNNRWLAYEDMVYIYNGILLSHKKEWNIAIFSNMDDPRDDHTQWSKSDRKRQILYDISYVWNIKNNTNESTYKAETDSGHRRVKEPGGRDKLGVWE